MAEQLGGLSSLTTPEAPAAVEIQKDPYVQKMEELSKARDEVLRRQKDLMSSLDQRVYQPADQFLAISQAMLSPTRTGSFFEAAGNVAGILGKKREEEDARAQQIAKMRMELGLQELGIRKDELEMARKQRFGQILERQLAQGAPRAEGAPTAVSAGPGGIPALPGQDRLVSRLSPEGRNLLTALAAVDPEKVAEVMAKAEIENSKTPESFKNISLLVAQLPPNLQRAAIQRYATAQTMGKPEEAAKSIIETFKALKEGFITTQQAQQMLESIEPSMTGAVARPKVTAAFQGDPAQVRAEIGRIQDPAKRAEVLAAYEDQLKTQQPEAVRQPTIPSQAAQERLYEKEQEGVIKSINEMRQSMRDAWKKSGETIQDANTMISLAQNTPETFGLLNKPGVASAALRLLEKSKIGPISTDVPELQSALRNIVAEQKGDPRIIESAQAAEFIGVRQSLQLAQLAKGSVSNYEQNLFMKGAYSLEDTPNTIIFKANLLRARAQFDQMAWQEYYKFEKSKRGNVEDFEMSKEYNDLRGRYKKVLEDISVKFTGKK